MRDAHRRSAGLFNVAASRHSDGRNESLTSVDRRAVGRARPCLPKDAEEGDEAAQSGLDRSRRADDPQPLSNNLRTPIKLLRAVATLTARTALQHHKFTFNLTQPIHAKAVPI
jgi:hypothetical protein